MPTEIAAAIDDLSRGFEEFKSREGARIAALEDELKAEKAEREDLELRLSRKGLAHAGRNGDLIAETKALSEFARGDAAQFTYGKKNMLIASDPDGGYAVMPEVSDTIRQKIFDVSPLARFANRVMIGASDSWEEISNWDMAGASWVGETESRSETTTPTLSKLRIPLHEITAMPKVTQRLLDDSAFDIGGFLTGKIGEKFAISEGSAYLSGDGNNKPEGLLTLDTSTADDSSRSWGTMQHVATGSSGAFPASNPADKIVDLVYSLRPPYRRNARFLMNLSTAAVVRKFKNGEGQYIWSESLAAGQPATLLGFPVELDEQMPDIDTDSLSIAFGDLRQAYTIIERPGLKLLRDPYTAKPHVLFYATRRVGGAVANSEAVKVLKFGTS